MVSIQKPYGKENGLKYLSISQINEVMYVKRGFENEMIGQKL
jgi:hypothetical protein